MESIVQLYSELAKDVTNKKEEEEKDEYKSNRIKEITPTLRTHTHIHYNDGNMMMIKWKTI